METVYLDWNLFWLPSVLLIYSRDDASC
jgi:hypothetical protein